ncbi:MAG: DUF1761 domain-containing protein [Rhodothermia bacterium]|nr:MAG: DUF1761 domain-containing protein [Rhodothermia bacterium]
MNTYSPDLLAVLVAGLVPMVVGAIWYGPLFGKKWMEMMGKTEDEIKDNFNPLKAYGISFIMALIMAFVLSHILQAWDDAYTVTGWAAGMQGAFWSWLGFVVTIGYQAMAWESKKFGLFAMNMAYNLVVLLGMGAILGVWR